MCAEEFERLPAQDKRNDQKKRNEWDKNNGNEVKERDLFSRLNQSFWILWHSLSLELPFHIYINSFFWSESVWFWYIHQKSRFASQQRQHDATYNIWKISGKNLLLVSRVLVPFSIARTAFVEMNSDRCECSFFLLFSLHSLSSPSELFIVVDHRIINLNEREHERCAWHKAYYKLKWRERKKRSAKF